MGDAAVNGKLVIGRISGCYGIKGWVKIHAFTDPPQRLLDYSGCRLDKRSGEQPVEFDKGRLQGKGLIAHIKGVDDRNLAETLKGLDIVVDAGELPTLPEGDYYWHQLEGLAVVHVGEENPVLLGRVKQMMETGANDVIVVSPTADSVDDRERLLPYLMDSVVVRIDVTEGVIDVDWPTDF